MGSRSDESIYWIFTSRNYNLLQHFQDCCKCNKNNYNTLKITVTYKIKSSTFQLLKCFQRRFTTDSILEFYLQSDLVLSQSYFTTGGLPSITSSWRQAPWDPRPDFFFPTELLR
jgi:hypothetical protein